MCGMCVGGPDGLNSHHKTGEPGREAPVWFVLLAEPVGFPEALTAQLSPQRQAKAHTPGGIIGAWGELLARVMLCRATGAANADLRFGREPTGKPILLSHPWLHFNLSHSRNALLCGLSHEPIGVDVERLRPPSLRVAERCFTAGERQYLHAAPDEAERRFFQVWTRKEAILKRRGDGIRSPLAELDTLTGPDAATLRTLELMGCILSVSGGRPLEGDGVRCLSEAELAGLGAGI